MLPESRDFRHGNVIGRVVVSVSTSRSRDGLETYQRLVSVSSRSLPFTSRAQDHALTDCRLACRWRRTQCERALDVVSLCCSYYCSSY